MEYLIVIGVTVVIGLIFHYSMNRTKDARGNLFGNVIGAVFLGLIIIMLFKACTNNVPKPYDQQSSPTSE
jgi:hypothetical protein